MNQVNKKDKPKGFIAIASLLIVTTVSMFFAISMLKDGISNASLSLDSIFYENARANANSCLEDVLLRIKQEEEFDSGVAYAFSDQDSCLATLTWFAPFEVRFGTTERMLQIDVAGISNGFIRNFHYEASVAKYDVNYSNGNIEHMNVIDFISIDE